MELTTQPYTSNATIIFDSSHTFTSFSVDDIAKAKAFYEKTLDLDVSVEEMGNIMLHINGGSEIFCQLLKNSRQQIPRSVV